MLEGGVLVVYFADEGDWRVWIGDDLTARFVGRPGPAAEFTESGAMHEVKERWLAEVFAERDHAWAHWQQVAHATPRPEDRVGFTAKAMADGLMAKFSTNHPTLGQKLFAAVLANNVKLVRRSVARGAAVESRDELGRTPLMVATHADQPEMAEILLEASANVNARDSIEDTPFLYAGAEGRTEILKLILARDPDLKSTNRFGGTALIPAAEKGHLDNVRLLLGTEINVDHVNDLGWTALYGAVMHPRQGSETYRAIVQALLDADADATITDKQSRPPEQRAREVGNEDLADLIAAASKR